MAAAGLLLGASAPGLIDVLTRLPGFSLALNYRLVFLAGFGIAGLAALGAERVLREGAAGSRRLAISAGAFAALLGVAALAARGLFRERALPAEFVTAQALFAIAPVALLAVAAATAALRRSPARILAAALVLLAIQRGLEMGGTYPARPAGELAPSPPELDSIRHGSGRVVAAGGDMRPNGAAILGLEDVRGYESIVLDRFADTFPLWSAPQPASFNRVDDLTRPFLEFLSARYAVAGPGAVPPAGWVERARSASLAVFENPRALARAFAPGRVVAAPDSSRVLGAMAAETDFSRTAWVASLPGGVPEISNARAELSARESGADLLIELRAPAAAPVFIATSLPDWPGWRAESGGDRLDVQTVNHAFVGFWLPRGIARVRLSYAPPAFAAGLASAALGLGCVLLSWIVRSRRRTL